MLTFQERAPYHIPLLSVDKCGPVVSVRHTRSRGVEPVRTGPVLLFSRLSTTHPLQDYGLLPLHLLISFMQTINRFLYGPTPEDQVRAWQAKLRQESRMLDREMRQVWPLVTLSELWYGLTLFS